MSLKQMTNMELLTYYREHNDTEVINECLSRMGEVRDTPIPNQITLEEWAENAPKIAV